MATEINMQSWWGKIIGALFGILLLGPVMGPLGALIGIFVGHMFDKGLHRSWHMNAWGVNPAEQHHIQQVFFRSTFQVMGHVAKADGRVSENEIRHAKQWMQRMRLTPQQRKQAVHYFNMGKQPDFDLNATLSELSRVCHRQIIMLRMFVEIQYQLAMADGAVIPQKQQILNNISQRFGYVPYYAHSQQNTGNQQSYQQYTSGNKSYGYGGSAQYQAQNTLQDAHSLLEIKSSATNQEIKRAYRKLMSQHHPDKLIAKGLPEEMIKVATDKTQKIQKAYEQIRTARGIK